MQIREINLSPLPRQICEPDVVNLGDPCERRGLLGVEHCDGALCRYCQRPPIGQGEQRPLIAVLALQGVLDWAEADGNARLFVGEVGHGSIGK